MSGKTVAKAGVTLDLIRNNKPAAVGGRSGVTMADERINELTIAVTAFASWADFEHAMKNGYVPTLQRAPGRSKWAKNHTAEVIELRELIQAKGFRVFPETI